MRLHSRRGGAAVSPRRQQPMANPESLQAEPAPAQANSLRSALIEVCDRLGLSLSASQADTLIAYLDRLQRWNGTYNLTSVREPVQMLTQHLADCLAALGPLRRHLGEGSRRRLLDAGSGGGLPGAVIAALQPAWQVTCVDAVGKKAAFIRQVAGELGLSNLRAEHVRVEQLAAPGFDLITSRAFASLAHFTKLTQQHLSEHGVWMAMKGKTPNEELAALPDRIEVFHVEPLRVPGLNAERCLVWMSLKPRDGL
jgi:16S rRNA (guanine527-N7)-methyltransferase